MISSARFAVTVLGFAVAAAVVPVRADVSPDGSAAVDQAVRSVMVELGDVDVTYPAEAVVEATRQTVVAAQVMGRIVDMRVDAGQAVKRGDLLLRIDERETMQGVASADAGLAQAEAALANARLAYERAQSLRGQNFVSQSAVDQAESGYKAAQAQVAAARAGRGQATTTRSFTQVTAPLSGVVAARLSELGDMATPGKSLVSLYDPTELRVVANIPQHKLPELRGATRARVEFPDTGKWVDAAAVKILPTADPRTHTVQARVMLPADGAGVVPGMFARAHFVLGAAKKLTVPASAVIRRGEVAAVYVIDVEGRLAMRQLRLGERYGDRIEVLAGVKAGERIAADPVKAIVVARQNPADADIKKNK